MDISPAALPDPVKNTASGPATAPEPLQASREKQRVLQALQTRDREVRAHEAAHLSAAVNLATGGASFSYQTGPDGRQYAVGGEVSIDTSPGSSPDETIRKAQAIRRAATAPAQPSSQDQQVISRAASYACRKNAGRRRMRTRKAVPSRQILI